MIWHMMGTLVQQCAVIVHKLLLVPMDLNLKEIISEQVCLRDFQILRAQMAIARFVWRGRVDRQQ